MVWNFTFQILCRYPHHLLIVRDLQGFKYTALEHWSQREAGNTRNIEDCRRGGHECVSQLQYANRECNNLRDRHRFI